MLPLALPKETGHLSSDGLGDQPGQLDPACSNVCTVNHSQGNVSKDKGEQRFHPVPRLSLGQLTHKKAIVSSSRPEFGDEIEG